MNKKYRLNNKAFAISSIIYALLILFLIILTLIMAMLTRRKIAFDKAKNEIKDNLMFNNKTYSFDEKNEAHIFETPKAGYYKVELWGKQINSSDNGGSYTHAILMLNQSDMLFISLNACTDQECTAHDNNASISTITNKIMEAGNSSEITSTIFTDPTNNNNNLRCKKYSEEMVCGEMTITTSNILSPSIILSGNYMPGYNGNETIKGNKSTAHARITYLSDRLPETPIIETYIANSYNSTALATFSTDTVSAPNGFKISGGNTTYKIAIPDKGFAFNYKVTSGTLSFTSGISSENLTGTGNYITNSSGTITISSGANVKIENVTYKGNLVDIHYGNDALEAIPPIVQINCTNIANNTSGCTTSQETISSKAYVIINNVSSNPKYTSQIKINDGQWQDMTKKNGYSYKEISEAGAYRIYTRQVYNDTAPITKIRNPYESKLSNELAFTIN